MKQILTGYTLKHYLLFYFLMNPNIQLINKKCTLNNKKITYYKHEKYKIL